MTLKDNTEDQEDSIYRDTLAGIMTLGLCLSAMYGIHLAVGTLSFPGIDLHYFRNTYILPEKLLWPEQAERLMYVADSAFFIFAAPPLFWVFRTILLAVGRRRNLRIPYTVFTLAAFAGLLKLMVLTHNKGGFFYLMSNVLAGSPLGILGWTLIGLLLIVTEHKYRDNVGATRIYKFGSCCLLSLLLLHIFPMWVFDLGDIYTSQHHFMAYIHSVVQVWVGKTPSRDFIPQYGFYSLILGPLFHLTGLTIWKFTVVMAVLRCLFFAGIFWVLRAGTKSWSIALLGVSSVAWYHFLLSRSMGVDISFQYHPHRVVFPILLLLAACGYLSALQSAKNRGEILGKSDARGRPESVLKRFKRQNLWYFTGFVVSVMGIIWNPESGMVVFLSWMMLLVFVELTDAKSLWSRRLIWSVSIHAFWAIVFVFLIFGALEAAIWIRTGSPINFLQGLSTHSNLFYVMGYMMWPMRPIHTWNLVVLVYMLGFLVACRDALLSRETGQLMIWQSRMLFLLCILGIGLFSYYQGRSRREVLPAVWWPAFLVISIFAARLLPECSKGLAVLASFWKVSKTATKGIGNFAESDPDGSQAHDLTISSIFWSFRNRTRPLITKLSKIDLPSLSFLLLIISILMSGSMSLALQKDKEGEWGRLMKPHNHSGYAGALKILRKTGFVVNRTKPGSEVLIVAERAPIYYMYSRTAMPLKIPGLLELVTRRDLNKLLEFMESSKWTTLFVDLTDLPEHIPAKPIMESIEKIRSKTEVYTEECEGLLFVRRRSAGHSDSVGRILEFRRKVHDARLSPSLLLFLT